MKDRDRASMRRSQLFISLLVAALLATFTAGQCTTPDPEPFGVKLNQDLSIAGCLPFENVPQPQTLINSVRQWLPEYSNPQPSLLSTSNNPNLVFTTTSTIYITFVDEGAGYRNSLGYFVYDSNNRVISKVAVFPDVSTRKMSFDYLSADTVRAGDTVQVGPFAAGTRVGFFLIGNGFNNEYWRTDLSGSTYWTIDSLNPDKKRHIAMFKESTTGKVLIGIEDLYDLGDADYNDAVFFVEVDGRISNNQFPVVMLVTTPLNTDARVTLESNEGKPTRAVVLSLPSRGTLSQVNPDGTKGAPIEAANTAITSPFFHLIYSPARGTFGSPYTTFTVNQHMPDGQIIFVSVRVDVLSYPPYAPVPMSKNIDIFAGEMKLIQLEANDAQNLNVYATITRSPYYGVLYQYNSGVVGAPISSGVRLTDPLNRLYYQHGNPYATARGSDNFVFTVTNNLASSAGAVIQFAIDLRPNRPPSSQNIVLDIKEDESGLIEFVVSDPDRDPITVTILNFPIEGRIFLTPDGSSTGNQLSASNTIVTRVANRYRAIFVPNANRFGAPLVTYRFRVSDYRMFQEYTVTINVQSVNDLPTVTSTSVTIPEDSVMNRMSQRIWSVNLNPDMDNTQAELSIVITSYPEKGTLKDRNGVVVPRSSIPFVVPFNTEFFYEPTPIQFGTPYTSFSYQLSDPEGGRSPTATFVIHVFHVNHPPQLIVPSSVSVDMNTPTSIFINARDVDVGDTVRFRLIGVPWAWGWGSTLTMDSELIVYAVWYTMPSTGVVLTFTPYPNHYYDTSIHIQIWDSSSSADSKIIPIRVNYGNIPPIAYSYVYYTHEDTPRPIGLYATDANRPVEVLKYVITTLPTRGFLMYESVRITSVPYTLPGNSTLLFLNDPYSFGIPYATFSYVANDGRVNSAPATITVGVYHVNHAPLLPVVRSPIVAKRYTPQTFTVSLNDMDSGDTVAVIITLKAPFRGRVLFGSITVHNGYRTPFGASGTLTLTYIPPPEVAGVSADYGDNLDTISFRAIDNYSWTSSVLDVPINVEFVPRAPVIATNPTSISVPERDSIQQIISTKDEDSRPVTVTVKLAPAAGRLFLLDSSNQPTGDALTAGSTIFTAPGTGSASVLYSSPQPSSLTVSSGAVRDAYTLSTNNGARSTDLIVNVQVADKNFAPFISATPSVINMQQAQGAQSTTFVVSGGDPDGDMISAVILSMQTVAGVVVTHNQQPISVNTVLEGSLRAHSWGLAVSIPALTRGTVARINIEARDSAGLRSQALELLVEVTGVNFSPSALTTTAPLCLEDEFVDIELTASDDNGDVLEIFISQLPSVGTLTFQGQAISDAPIPLTDGMVTIRYAPPLLTYGSPTSSFRYFVSDGRARSSEVTIPLNVQHVNHAPRLTVQTLFNTEINVPATILINAQDVDSGDSLTLSVTSLPTKDGSKLRLGSQDVVLGRGYPISSSGLALVYQPSPNTFYDDDAIEIRLSDGMVPITQRIAIKVNYLNILPVASPQTVNATEDISSEILLSGTDDNIPSEQLTFIIATLPTRGILRYGSDRISTVPYTLSGTSALTFTNDQYSYGAPYATFSFVANDGRANSPAATVTINVAHVNHPPILQSAVNAIQTSRSQLVPILIVAQDFDIGNSLTATINSVAEGKGTLQLGGQNLTGQVTKSISGYESLEFTYTSRDAGEGEITEETFFTVSVQDGDGASADIRINITVKFDARPPIPLPISVVQLPERGNSSITLGGSDQDQLPVELWIETRPSKGSLYYLDSSSAQKKIVEFPFLIVSLNTSSVSTTLDYVHEYSGTTFSVGAESDSFSASIKNDDLSSTIMINIRIIDVNFAPTISSPLTLHSIPDAQLQRSVSFKIAGADPDNDELDAEITRHTQENIVISQNGLPIQLGNPLSKSSDGTWSFQVTVPALTVGVIDRITAVVTDGDLRSQELEFVVETTSTNFAPVALTTSVDTFLEDSFIEFSVSGRDDNGNDVLAGYVSGFPSVGVLYDGNGAEINTTEGLIPIVEGMMKLKYVPPLYTYGSPASGMRYYVTDGRLRSEEVSLLFNIQHVNHAPVSTIQSRIINVFEIPHADEDIIGLDEGEGVVILSGFDVDLNDTVRVYLNEIPPLSLGKLLINDTVVEEIPVDGFPLNTEIGFQPEEYVSGLNITRFSYYISDGIVQTETVTVEINIVDINHEPEVYKTEAKIETEENTAVEFSLILEEYAKDFDGDEIHVFVSEPSSNGSLSEFSRQGSGSSETWTITYTPSFDLSAPTFGDGFDSFEVSFGDGKTVASRKVLVSVDVKDKNFAPTGDNVYVNVKEVSEYTLDFSGKLEDIDNDELSIKILNLPSDGAVIVAGRTLVQSDIPVIVSSTQLTDVVISRGDSEIIDVFFEYTVFDGTIESEAKYNISVYILGYLNYPPVAVLDADYVEIPENKRMPISWGGFDRNGDTLSAYITELPSRGSLHQTSNGISVGERISVGDVVLITDKWRVMYQPESYDAIGPFSFSFYLNDSQAISPVAKIEIGVTDVNYPPTCFGQPSIVYMEEDGEALIKLKGVDQDNDKVSAQLTAEPSRGLLFLADASGSIIDENPIRMPSSLEVYEFPASNNGEWYVLYRPPADKSGNGYSRFYFRVVDTQSEASVETVVLINVRAVNDPPTIVAPTNITTISTSPVSVKGVSVKEVDSISPSGVAFSATITADIGLISVSNIAGATIKPDDFATGVSSISISASYATLNQALSSLVYIPPVGVNGTTSINITVSDNGNTGIGPAYTTTAILAVEITSPADEVPADDSVTSAIAGGAVGATAAIAGAFWVFKKVTQKEDYNFTIPEKEGDTFASNPLYDANSAMGAMHSNPLYDSGSP
eukprot:TRINITY_DN9465_c0_g1_i4.p1 TRINITY_DN9465_c0_g1~~TRINITY_DN9465_c0_g1_i4.p1  ORF type:complete len:2849 (-),score=551.06 TRINITY_DN9465_c0_g1_i4:264-8810(-)